MTQLPSDFESTPFRDPRRLFRPATVGMLSAGTLIRFRYVLWKHDPQPLVIVTDRMYDGDIRGVNVKYLTMNYVSTMIQTYCGEISFSYRNLIGTSYLTRAFRRYKSFGIQNLEIVDCELILRLIDMVRTRDPHQEKAMREEVQRQLQRQMNQPADEFVTEDDITMPPIEEGEGETA